MPIQTGWKNTEKTMLAFIYEGSWTIEDFYAISQQGNTLLREVTHPVTIILDVQNSRMMPSGFMTALRKVYGQLNPNVDSAVMVGINTFARVFIQVFQRIYTFEIEKPVYFAANDAEVPAIVASHAKRRINPIV